MRQVLVRLSLALVALTAASCSNGPGDSLSFTNLPNGSGGSSGSHQPGANGTALVRFVNGDPGAPSIDFCIDSSPVYPSPTVSYGSALPLFALSGGIKHTLAAYVPPAPGFGSSPGSECATAPGPYFGESALATIAFDPGASGSGRETVVLGGTAASGTLAFYIFGEPNYTSVAGNEAVSNNAAPAFSAVAATHAVGFGSTPGGTLANAGAITAPMPSGASSTSVNGSFVSPLAAIPTSFYDGAGSSGAVAPIGSASAPAASSPYVVELYAIDGSGGGLNLIAVPAAQLTF